MWMKFGILIIILACVCACEDSGGNSLIVDGGTDTDTDGDSDTDGDTDGDSDSDTDGDTDGDSDPSCADIPWEVTYNPINMLVLLDRSKSMADNEIDPSPPSDDTYAAVTATAIEDVVAANMGSGLINFGLAVFPSMSCPADDPGGHPNSCRPSAADADDPGYGSPEVDLPGTLTQIQTALDASGGVGQCGGTPICQSLQWALSYLNWTGPTATYPTNPLDISVAMNQNFILLATDGAPNCNAAHDLPCTSSEVGDPVYFPTQCLDDLCTYNAALHLAAAGIKVFVIGVGSSLSTWDSVMDDIANWGGTGQYYAATDATDLQIALTAITGEAINCLYTVDWDSIPDLSPDPPYTPVDKGCDKVWIYGVPANSSLDDIPLQYMPDANCAGEDPGNDVYGWRWQGISASVSDLDNYDTTQCTEIELCPEACQKLKDFEWDTITAKFGCEILID